MSNIVRCTFYVRAARAEGGYTYSMLDPAAPSGVAGFPTSCPPAVGDIVFGLSGPTGYRVVARQWELPQYGSMTWPSGQSSPKDTSMTVIVEPADGVFADEASDLAAGGDAG